MVGLKGYKMEFIKKYQSFIAIGLAVVGLGALVVMSSNNSDQADNKSAKTDASALKIDAGPDGEKKQDTTKLATVYNYTAQPGDSYTVLARKAVQAYAKSEKQKLSSAQIIAAETRLTVDAGSIELNEGQTLAIDKAAVKAAVDAAKKLGATELAAWEVYVPYVDFDTSKAGQKA